jgi:hypothetical protein
MKMSKITMFVLAVACFVLVGCGGSGSSASSSSTLTNEQARKVKLESLAVFNYCNSVMHNGGNTSCSEALQRVRSMVSEENSQYFKQVYSAIGSSNKPFEDGQKERVLTEINSLTAKMSNYVYVPRKRSAEELKSSCPLNDGETLIMVVEN